MCESLDQRNLFLQSFMYVTMFGNVSFFKTHIVGNATKTLDLALNEPMYHSNRTFQLKLQGSGHDGLVDDSRHTLRQHSSDHQSSGPGHHLRISGQRKERPWRRHGQQDHHRQDLRYAKPSLRPSLVIDLPFFNTLSRKQTSDYRLTKSNRPPQPPSLVLETTRVRQSLAQAEDTEHSPLGA